MRRSWLFSLFLPLVAAACESALGPDRGDPAQFTFSEAIAYKCGSWSTATAPSQSLGLFDVYFKSSLAAGIEPPSRQDLERIVRFQGTIVQPFQVNGVRAILPVAAVPQLGAPAVLGVVQPNVLEHSVSLGFDEMGEGWRIYVHGGRIAWQASLTPDFFAVVPDTGIRGLSREASLRFMELTASGCGGRLQ
jgi:hypothetical protein